MPTFNISNGYLHYERIPNVLPSDVVFIHGNLASNGWWDPVIHDLNTRTFEKRSGSAFLVEWRGHGQSSGPQSESDLRLSQLADDLCRFVSHLRSGPVHLVGHSTGGIIAFRALAQSPSLFDQSVLLDPVGLSGFQMSEEQRTLFELMSRDSQVAGEIVVSTIYDKRQLSIETEKRVRLDAGRVAKMNYLGVPMMLSQIECEHLASLVHHPTLILHGEFDSVLKIEESRRMAKLLPQGRFKEISGYGHCLNLENPKLFADELCGFFEWSQSARSAESTI